MHLLYGLSTEIDGVIETVLYNPVRFMMWKIQYSVPKNTKSYLCLVIGNHPAEYYLMDIYTNSIGSSIVTCLCNHLHYVNRPNSVLLLLKTQSS